MEALSTPKVIRSEEANEDQIECQTFLRSFWPLPFATGRYAQTVLPSFIRRTVNIPYEREIIKLEDGGTVAIDWVRSKNQAESKKQSSLVIVLCPGLTGTSKSKYIQQSVIHLMDQMQKTYPDTQVSIGVFIYRGNAGLPLTVSCTPSCVC